MIPYVLENFQSCVYSEKVREVLCTFVKNFTIHALSENYIA